MSHNSPSNESRPKDGTLGPGKALASFVHGWGFVGTLFGAFCAGIWSKLSDTEFSTWIIIAGGCACLFLVCRNIFQNPRWRFWLPFGCTAAVILSSLLITNHLNKWAAGQQPLSLYLLSTEAGSFQLELSDKEFFKKRKSGEYAINTTLVVPVRDKNSEATLRFLIRNNSETKSVNGFQMGVAFTDDLEVSPGALASGRDWGIASSSLSGVKNLMATRFDRIYPRQHVALNDVGLRPKLGWTNPPPNRLLLLNFSTENAPPFGCALHLVCPVMKEPKQPYLVRRGETYEVPLD